MLELSCCGTHRLSVLQCDVGKLCSHNGLLIYGDAESAKHPLVYFSVKILFDSYSKFLIFNTDININGLVVLCLTNCPLHL